MGDLRCRSLHGIPAEQARKRHRQEDAEQFNGCVAQEYPARNQTLKVWLSVFTHNDQACGDKTEEKEHDRKEQPN